MTRQEQIRDAIDTIIPIFRSNNGRTYEQALMASSFEAGVNWADDNPKSPWISVNDDLPNDETEWYIIYCEAYNKNGDDIENKHHEIFLENFDKETSLWVNIESYNNYFFDVLYWMEIPELPKDVCSIISNLNSKHQ